MADQASGEKKNHLSSSILCNISLFNVMKLSLRLNTHLFQKVAILGFREGQIILSLTKSVKKTLTSINHDIFIIIYV